MGEKKRFFNKNESRKYYKYSIEKFLKKQDQINTYQGQVLRALQRNMKD